MKSQHISFIQLFLSFTFLLNSCVSQNNSSTKPSDNKNNFDSCSVAKSFENAEISQSMVSPDYSGVLNNYWGTDTTKIDFQHFFDNGKLIKSTLYYENGKVQEEFTYKCGALNGVQKYFYENGNLSKTIPYSYGYRQGTGELYDEKGILRQQVIFIADSVIGEPKNFDENGNLIKQ